MAKITDKQKSFQRPRGTHDILPEEQPWWDLVRDVIARLSAFYGFGRIETPHFESTDLFTHGTGEATDIVTKQMYSFKTRGGDHLTLRPEGTPPIARAYIEHGMASWPQPVKLYYLGAMFRHESPQKSRFREFNQWGLEFIGEPDAVADAEIIQLAILVLRELGITDFMVEVNSVGCPACRPAYRSQLTQYYKTKVAGLCRDCKERFKTNPLRLLDCSEEKCMQVKKGAPQILDKLCEACRSHFKLLLEFLEEAGIPYVLNPHLVRGLDYYMRTVFEAFVNAPVVPAPNPAPVAEGAETDVKPPEVKEAEPARKLAMVGGGRYDGLIELVGGKPTPAVGSAMGIERLVEVLRARNVRVPQGPKPKVFLVQLGDLAKRKSFRLMEELRKAGIVASSSLGRDSIRSQLKVADRLGVPYSLILGQKEALDDVIILREMSSGMQETIPQSKLVESLKKKPKR